MGGNVNEKSESGKPENWLMAMREPYLAFLRNHTPQIFLATMMALFASKLTDHITFEGWLPTIGFGTFGLLLIYSVFANFTVFFQAAFPVLLAWKSKKSNKFIALIWEGICANPAKIIGAGFTLIGLEFLFASVVLQGIGLAYRFIKMTH